MKLMIPVLFILSILSVCLPLHGKKLAVLPEVMKPRALAIDNGQIFVTDRKVTHIYNLKDFKLVKSFGKEGEGPGEFKYAQKLTPYPEYLLIFTIGKIMYFSRQGEFLRETKLDMTISGVSPLGDGYFGRKMRSDKDTGKRFSDYTVFGADFQTVKVLASHERQMRRTAQGKFVTRMLYPHIMAVAYQDQIFLGDTNKGFYIGVYNNKGEKLYQITRDYQKQKVTDTYKTRFMGNMKKSKNYQRMKDMFIFEFAEYYPAYSYFSIHSDKIFVLLHGDKKDKGDFMLLDLKGKPLKTGAINTSLPYTVHEDRVYYLKENEDEEEWELLVEDL
jgi:hypothetical protein